MPAELCLFALFTSRGLDSTRLDNSSCQNRSPLVITFKSHPSSTFPSSYSFILHHHEQSITISTTTPPSGLIAFLSSRLPTRYSDPFNFTALTTSSISQSLQYQRRVLKQDFELSTSCKVFFIHPESLENQLTDLEPHSTLLRSIINKDFKALFPKAVNVSQFCFHLHLFILLHHMPACIHSAIHCYKVLRHCFCFLLWHPASGHLLSFAPLSPTFYISKTLLLGNNIIQQSS